MSFLTSANNERWVSSSSYLFDTINFDDLFFVTDTGNLCCRCFRCKELESIDKVLDRSLFPLNFLFFRHTYSERIYASIQNLILRSWDHESVYTLIVAKLPELKEISISDLYDHCSQHFDIPFIPHIHIFDLAIIFGDGSLKSDVFPFWVSSLIDKKSIYSRIPLMQYFERGLQGFSFRCRKCDFEFFCLDNDLKTFGDSIY